MGVYHTTDQASIRVQRTDQEIRDARNQDARIVIAGRALKRPDPERFLLDILACLGLDGRTDCPPSPVRLLAPDEFKSPAKRPADATSYTEPDEPPQRNRGGRPKGEIIHGSRGGPMAHRRRGEEPCDACREAYNRDQRNRKAAARADTPPTPTDQSHGVRSTYLNHACRCDACRAAQVEYSREYRRQHPKKKAAQ